MNNTSSSLIDMRRSLEKLDDTGTKNKDENIRLSEAFKHIQLDVGTIKTDITNVKADITTIKRELDNMNRDVGILKTETRAVRKEMTTFLPKVISHIHRI